MDDRTRAKANELYWESDASVGQIADELGISRRALYDNIDPSPAGADCPECGGALGFRNRTAADSGEAECAECGYEQDVGELPDAPEIEREARGARMTPVGRAVPAAGAAPLLGGVMLAGVAVGAAVGYVVRRR